MCCVNPEANRARPTTSTSGGRLATHTLCEQFAVYAVDRFGVTQAGGYISNTYLDIPDPRETYTVICIPNNSKPPTHHTKCTLALHLLTQLTLTHCHPHTTNPPLCRSILHTSQPVTTVPPASPPTNPLRSPTSLYLQLYSLQLSKIGRGCAPPTPYPPSEKHPSHAAPPPYTSSPAAPLPPPQTLKKNRGAAPRQPPTHHQKSAAPTLPYIPKSWNPGILLRESCCGTT